MDTAQGMGQGQDVSSSTPVTPVTDSSIQSQVSEPVERTFRQSEVNDIVKRVKHGAVEDYKRLQSEQPAYAQQKYGDSQQMQNHQQSSQYQFAQQESEIRRLASEEAQRLREQWVNDARNQYETDYAKKTVQNFWNKVMPGKEKYQDFENTVLKGINFEIYPSVVQILSEHIDNADEVMYHLAKDESKMAEIENLALNPKYQHLAVGNIKRLSQSIKDNESAGKVKTPNEPLSQMRPSTTATDSSAMTVSDYRRKYKV